MTKQSAMIIAGALGVGQMAGFVAYDLAQRRSTTPTQVVVQTGAPPVSTAPVGEPPERGGG